MAKVKDVFIFTNGNVMVMDENGEQMSEYQGFILDVASKLAEACDKDTNFEISEWKDWRETLDFSWWFEKRDDHDHSRIAESVIN